MAIQQIIKVWKHDLTKGQQAVALVYADHANEDGTGSYPSVWRIAWKTGRSRRNVQTIKSELENDVGLLVKTREATHERPDEYRLDWSGVPEKPDFAEWKESKKSSTKGGELSTRGEESSPPKEGGGGEVSSPPGAKSSASRGEDTSPEPSLPNRPNNHHRAQAREDGGGNVDKENKIEELTDVGLGESTARRLVNNYEWGSIYAQLRHYQYKRQRGGDGAPESPGWIASAVENGYDLPMPVRRTLSSQ